MGAAAKSRRPARSTAAQSRGMRSEVAGWSGSAGSAGSAGSPGRPEAGKSLAVTTARPSPVRANGITMIITTYHSNGDRKTGHINRDHDWVA
jgi:hypothetical protein